MPAMKMTIANQLTLMRIVFIPVFVVIFYLPYEWRFFYSALIFAVVSVTDWLDGWVARQFNQSTPFGAFLDPVADKLMVVVALVLMIESYEHMWFTIPALVIIGREVFISALREWMAALGKSAEVSVSMVGKVKTTLQMMAIGFLLWNDPANSDWTGILGFTLFYIAVLLTLWSMLIYLKAAWPIITSIENNTSE